MTGLSPRMASRKCLTTVTVPENFLSAPREGRRGMVSACELWPVADGIAPHAEQLELRVADDGLVEDHPCLIAVRLVSRKN